jgi:dipeptidyl aminopeptidase/acylaminoacyl peptidase
MIFRLLMALGTVLFGTVALAQSDARSPSEMPIADFFKRPTVASPRLSPNGLRIASLVPGPSGRTVLAVADVTTPNKRVVVANFDDADVRSFKWVNDKRLVFDAIDFQSPLGEQFGGGLYAIDVDGSNFVFLIGRGLGFESGGHAAIRPLRWNHVLYRTLRDGSDDVIVERYNLRSHRDEPVSSALLRLNTYTRATKELIKHPPDNASGWILDSGGTPRAALTTDSKDNVKVILRSTEISEWVEIAAFNRFAPGPGSFTPVAFDADGSLIVAALRADSARTSALFRFDAAARRLASEPFVALKGFDLIGGIVFDQTTKRMVGVDYDSDAAGTVWLEAGMREVQARVDALLTTTVNLVVCETCLTQQRFVVTAWSDRQSPLYFLFDRTKTGKDSLTLIGVSRPWLDAERMATQDMVRINSRDGLEFPVYVTKPKGKGPWPTVVLVHGGPYVRGNTWGWNADAQFLASRGYLVVEPEFRGSTGYGDKLFKAGWKQWGLKMQDDITDATHWAVAQGLADAKRLVIAGASYGGYATMMGLVKEPDLYRAGINWVGVTDIDLMYSISWSDFDGSVWQRFGMPKLVGDRGADRAQLDATSPLKRAAEITKPVLMAYGGQDYRVPLPHGQKMRDALRAAGKVEVEWVEYELEGHGFLLEKNVIDFWSRVERFLARHTR